MAIRRTVCLRRSKTVVRLLAVWLACCCGTLSAAPPAPPQGVTAVDHPHDDGTSIDVIIPLASLAANGTEPGSEADSVSYVVQKAVDSPGVWEEVAVARPSRQEIRSGALTVTAAKLVRGNPYWFRVAAVHPQGEQSAWVTPANLPVRGTRQAFDGSRTWLLVVLLAVCGSIVGWLLIARTGRTLYVRPIAGLEAVEEAVGRATEMGRSCVYVPGILDMNEMQTIAGLTILSRVAERAAEYDCRLETPTSKSLVMTAARDVVQSAYLTAGRPDAFNPDDVYYISDDQFAYVSAITGRMVREKPAACFYLGSFFAESLILAETGNSIGAIQVAGTAQPAQLPFFVAACDYTLIGEEFFAASAYLSRDPDQLGSLKGQDLAKILVVALILIGVVLVTVADLTGNPSWVDAAGYLKNTVLGG